MHTIVECYQANGAMPIIQKRRGIQEEIIQVGTSHICKECNQFMFAEMFLTIL